MPFGLQSIRRTAFHRFKDRWEAGARLANRLSHLRGKDVLVIALLRGGLPTARKVAFALSSELEVLPVARIRSSRHSNRPIGATTEDQMDWIDDAFLPRSLTEESSFQSDIAKARHQIDEMNDRFFHGRGSFSVLNRDVILVDDQIESGSSMRVAAKYLREKGAKSITVAVPVGLSGSLDLIRPDVDSLVCLVEYPDLSSLKKAYEDFGKIEDDDLVQLVDEIRRERHLREKSVEISVPGRTIHADLHIPATPVGIVVFLQGGSGGRYSPRGLTVAQQLNESGMGTVLMDLVSDQFKTSHIKTLSLQLVSVLHWIREEIFFNDPVPMGVFSSNSGTSVAFCASLKVPGQISAIASRNGRFELSAAELRQVDVPTLLMVGDQDEWTLAQHQLVAKQLPTSKLHVISGVENPFDNSSALHEMTDEADMWFLRHFITDQRIKVA